MKVERYIREYASAILRKRHISELEKSNVEAALSARERGTITAEEAMLILSVSANKPEIRMHAAAHCVYYNTEHDELITLNQLLQEWQNMTQEERKERGGEEFDDFLQNCMSYNNGVLMHFSEWIDHRLK